MNNDNKLTSAEEAALCEVARGSLMQKVIPIEIKERLVKLGYIEQKLGGLVATSKGKLWAMKHCSKSHFA
jgi:hypothetical protein